MAPLSIADSFKAIDFAQTHICPPMIELSYRGAAARIIAKLPPKPLGIGSHRLRVPFKGGPNCDEVMIIETITRASDHLPLLSTADRRKNYDRTRDLTSGIPLAGGWQMHVRAAGSDTELGDMPGKYQSYR